MGQEVLKGSAKKLRRLPDLTGMKSEIVIQKAHRNSYDHAFRMVGVNLIEVAERALHAVVEADGQHGEGHEGRKRQHHAGQETPIVGPRNDPFGPSCASVMLWTSTLRPIRWRMIRSWIPR